MTVTTDAPSAVLATVAARATAVLADPRLDHEASAHLFAALGEVPLRVTDAVTAGQLSASEAEAAVGLAVELQAGVRAHAIRAQSEGLARVQRVLEDATRGVPPSALLAAAPAALCEACGFDRALISRVEGPGWVPRVLHTTRPEAAQLADLLTGLQIPLKAGLVETEVVRRRTTAVVQDAQNDSRTYRPLVEQAGVRSYVVAPIVVGDRVVALVHADRPDTDGRLTRADRDLVALFADRFGKVYERAVLTERVAQQRASLRRALHDGTHALDDDPSVVRFAPAAPRLEIPATTSYSERRREDGLSARELDVLTLLAAGSTNGQIAARLVLSEGTVQWHVKRILHKLGAANRAEAAYLFLRGSASRTRAG